MLRKNSVIISVQKRRQNIAIQICFPCNRHGKSALQTYKWHKTFLDAYISMGRPVSKWKDDTQFLFFAGVEFTISVVSPAQIKAYDASRLTQSKTDAIGARRYTEPFGLVRYRNKTLMKTINYHFINKIEAENVQD
jgi:hypothetical protein